MTTEQKLKTERYTRWLMAWVESLPEVIAVEHRPGHMGEPYRWEVFEGPAEQPAKSIGFIFPWTTQFAKLDEEEARPYLYNELRALLAKHAVMLTADRTEA